MKIAVADAQSQNINVIGRLSSSIVNICSTPSSSLDSNRSQFSLKIVHKSRKSCDAIECDKYSINAICRYKRSNKLKLNYRTIVNW